MNIMLPFFIYYIDPKVLFVPSDFHCFGYINALLKRFNIELLSWWTSYKQVAKSYLAPSIKDLGETLWPRFRYCCLWMEQPCTVLSEIDCSREKKLFHYCFKTVIIKSFNSNVFFFPMARLKDGYNFHESTIGNRNW